MDIDGNRLVNMMYDRLFPEGELRANNPKYYRCFDDVVQIINELIDEKHAELNSMMEQLNHEGKFN
jgi:hypothetical protein